MGTASPWMWGWMLFPHWSTPQTPSWRSVGQDKAMLRWEGSAVPGDAGAGLVPR